MELTLMARSLILSISINSAINEATFLGGFSWNRVLTSEMMLGRNVMCAGGRGRRYSLVSFSVGRRWRGAD
jgi:hypothetical protein